MNYWQNRYGWKNNKYGNIKTEACGRTFDSRKEAARYLELAQLQEKGEITDLKCQVPFLLIPAFRYQGKAVRKCEYIADFTYTAADGRRVVEDVKGGMATQTAEFRIKRKLLLQKYGADIDFRTV